MTSRVRWLSAGIVLLIVLAGVVIRQAVAGPAAPRALPSVPALPSASTGAPAASPSVPAPSASPGSCADTILAGLSARERAGQALMVGTSVAGPRDLGPVVARHRLGGVFLAGRSTRSAAGLRADIAALQGRAATPLLVALDQEGGSVQTLKGRDFPLIPSAKRLGAGPRAKLRDTVRDSAQRLAGIGVTVNLAPVADTVPAKLGEGNPPIGGFHRQYGSDPDRVAEDITTVVAASQGADVLTIVKHFPGLGRVSANTDTAVRVVDNTTTADDPYLKPFVAGINAGSAGVMISSATYPKLDGSAIAAYSKPIVTGLLRDRLGFTGLVMSDDLGAADAASSLPAGERAVRFVAAGGDLALTIRPQDAAPMAASLTAAARKSPAFAARLTDAARHVLRAKERAGLLKC
ncbi:glycoside hydrolase family 3 N-terminal domain-containing protein [Actinoplanes sp. NPDC049599]|uniref:glycoside hydrolase family 3 N-terminal domain-containing protein n=1 Tax=Actinoplanes sp. NPDC049599 TaxID=3363903 RepID=UPI0037B922EE